MRNGKFAVYGLSFLIFCLVVPRGVSGWVLTELKRRLDVEIQGDFVPAFFGTSFDVRRAHVNWEDKVELVSGDVRVDYEIFPYVFQNLLRVQISGRSLPVRLGSEWKDLGGIQAVTLDQFFVDILLAPRGIKDIVAFSAKAPELEFQMGQTQVKKG